MPDDLHHDDLHTDDLHVQDPHTTADFVSGAGSAVDSDPHVDDIHTGDLHTSDLHTGIQSSGTGAVDLDDVIHSDGYVLAALARGAVVPAIQRGAISI